jgi:hypothetical protein
MNEIHISSSDVRGRMQILESNNTHAHLSITWCNHILDHPADNLPKYLAHPYIGMQVDRPADQADSRRSQLVS